MAFEGNSSYKGVGTGDNGGGGDRDSNIQSPKKDAIDRFGQIHENSTILQIIMLILL